MQPGNVLKQREKTFNMACLNGMKPWCCVSDEDRKAINRSKQIDHELKQQKIQFKRTVKILLLGSGESGKSTFLKQMKIIHGNDFSKDERENHKSVIYGNIVKGMKVLIDARDKLNISWGNPDNARHAKYVFSFNNIPNITESLFLEYVESIELLWCDSGIRRAFDRRREYQLVKNHCLA